MEDKLDLDQNMIQNWLITLIVVDSKMKRWSNGFSKRLSNLPFVSNLKEKSKSRFFMNLNNHRLISIEQVIYYDIVHVYNKGLQ